ncbi:MAG: polyprenyl synthetase family protein [Acidimicrobiia bacterium]|nr:polyprenyl synthetase family protein [Acidimicrobiia bacterium]
MEAVGDPTPYTGSDSKVTAVVDSALALVTQRMTQLAPASPGLDSRVWAGLLDGGKRLRAGLLLDCAVAVGGSPRDAAVLDAAAVVELVHLGTLIHDDIMDGSLTRRGAPTVNAVHGNVAAGYAGLLTLSYAVGALEGLPDWAYGVTQETLAEMCEGQFAEAMSLHDPARSVADYLAAVEGKTGSLFGLAAYLGVRLGCGTTALAEDAREAARAVGVAYQIGDDLCDLDAASAARRGKPAGADLRAGVFTLPVLLARERAESVTELLDRIEVDPDVAAEVVTLVTHTHADDEARHMAEETMDAALDQTDVALAGPLRRLAARVRSDLTTFPVAPRGLS